MNKTTRTGVKLGWVLVMACGAFLTQPSNAAPVPAMDVPAYRLHVGQLLAYEESGNSANGTTKMESKTHLKIYVASQAAGGAWNLVMVQQQSTREIGTPGENQPHEYPESLSRATLAPNGDVTVEENSVEGMMTRQLVQGLFFPLPAAASDKTWTRPGAFGATVTYQIVTPAQPDSGVWEISSETDSPENKIYLATNKSRAWVDAAKGLPIKAQTDRTQDYRSKSTASMTWELKDVEEKDAASMAQLDKETLLMGQATQQYQAQFARAEDDPAHIDTIMAEAEKSLRDAVSQTTLDSTHKPLQALLNEHAGNVKRLKDEAAQPAMKIGTAAPAWQGSSLAGKPLSLADLKGKVVVMDFWYRGCGWCMRAMPQINEMAADFKDQPVVVLGINIDEDTNDAQFVVDKLGLNYATVVHAQDIATAYHVRAYPTLIIVDQDGNVRNRDVGYSPDVKRKVSGEINALLKK